MRVWYYLSRYKGMLPEQIAAECGVMTLSVRRQLYRYEEGIEPMPEPMYITDLEAV